MQLWVDTHIGRKKWLESIDRQQGLLREKSTVFISETITEGILNGVRKVNCSSPYGESPFFRGCGCCVLMIGKIKGIG